MATRWTIRHSLMLLGFKDLMNVTEEVTIHRPNGPTLLSGAFIRGDLNAATRGPFLRSLLSCLFFWRGVNGRQEVSRHYHDRVFFFAKENIVISQNSCEFADFMKDKTLNTWEELVSFDVISLFTKIPVDLTVKDAVERRRDSEKMLPPDKELFVRGILSNSPLSVKRIDICPFLYLEGDRGI